MKLIIAGSRTLTPSTKFLYDIIYMYKIQVTEIVSGGAKGIDFAAKMMSVDFYNLSYFDRNKSIPLPKYKEFPADWDKYGKAAGPIRNREMAEYGDALLLIWDGESRGSANMKATMSKLNKPVYEVILKHTN